MCGQRGNSARKMNAHSNVFFLGRSQDGEGVRLLPKCALDVMSILEKPCILDIF